jgi:DNA-binding CsgD family transcriptional regulator
VGEVHALLEREAELGTIRAAVEATVAGDGRALVIEGEAGAGKTRLLAEARGIAAGSGAEVLTARAGELERDFPFAVSRQLLVPRLRQAASEELKTLFDGAAPARGALGLAASDEKTSADTFSVLHALYWVIAGLAEQSPLLLVVDDAHLADAASLDWLGFMLPRLDELPVSLVLARRTDESESPGLARIVGDQSVEALHPAPLSGEATAALIGEVLSRDADPSFAAACHEITGGNPFLVTELGRELAEQGIDPGPGSSDAARVLAPQRVAQTVLARISRLPAEAVALARAVAILGDGCEPALANRLAGLGLDSGRRAADSLRAAAILDPDETLRFNHPLVRNAVYADLAIGDRAAAHAAAAGLLRSAGAPPERIAIQLLAGEPREDSAAAETLLAAGHRALVDGAPRSAVSFLTRALQEPPPAGLRLKILRQLLAAAIRAADHGVLVAIEAEVLAAIERDPAETRDLAIQLPSGMVLAGRFEEAGRILSAAVQAAADERDIDNAFKLDSALRSVGMVFPSIEEVDLQRYVGLVEPDSAAARLAAAVEARAAVMEESRPAAIEAARRALGNDCSLFEEEPEMMSATGSVLILLIADEMDAASKATERAFEIARERNAMPEIGRAWLLRGMISWGYGDLVAAESALRQAREIATLAGISPLWFVSTGPLALILIWRDQLDDAEATLAEINVTDGPVPPGALFLLPLMVRARARFERGDYASCLEDIGALTAQSEQFGGGPSPALSLAVEEIRALLAMGRTEEARARADLLVNLGRKWGAPATMSHLFRAAAAAAEGAEEIEMLKESVAASMGSPRRLQAAEALVDLGSALRRQNHRAAARDPLREGLKLARRCGAIRLVKHAREELRATGETVRRYAPIGVESLTPSERRVAELAMSGMTNRQIAQSLFVTLKTVEAHLSAAYDKLDIKSRRELRGALGGAREGD